MKAKIKPGYNNIRRKLSDIVPLETPFTIYIAATQKCNFRCSYCTHGLSVEEKENVNLQQVHLSDEIFNKIVGDAKKFNDQIKKITFTGLGEPLFNLKIPEMLKKLSANNIAKEYEIVTNGYLLNHDMADRLIDSGLTYLKISIQGLSSKKYKEISGVDVDFNRLLDNIRYFYEHRGKCKVYIKIMDICFDEGETEKDFYNLFGDICDHIYIEHLFNAQPKMNGKYGDRLKEDATYYGEKKEIRAVCPLAFYFLQIDALGNVFPCSPLGPPIEMSIGNIMNESLLEIWNSEKRYELLIKHLTGRRNEITYCTECGCSNTYFPKEDNLDYDRNQILERIKEKRKEWQK